VAAHERLIMTQNSLFESLQVARVADVAKGHGSIPRKPRAFCP